MGPFEKITGFEWDKGNEQKNVKHRVTPAEAEQVFLNEPLVVLDDLKHSDTEQRFHALGQTGEGRLLHITFTIRSNMIRVISARNMHRKERAIYEQET
ncbi:MAG: BrnT family toxin [Desulfuromonadaceae bacterium]